MTCICGHSYHAGVGGSCLTEGCHCFKLRYVTEAAKAKGRIDSFVSDGNYPNAEWPRWKRLMEMEFEHMPVGARDIFAMLSYPMRSEAVQ